MNTKNSTQDRARLMNEAEAHFHLGLRDEAERQVDQYIETFGADVPSLEMKLGMVSSRGDYRMAAAIAKASPAFSSISTRGLYEVSIAGDPAWAFSNCLSMEASRSDSAIYWFNRACFASGTGLFPEAIRSLIRSFCLSGRYHADSFLDPDLEPLWLWMAKSSGSEAHAEILSHGVWRTAIRSLEDCDIELTLTPVMRPRVPKKFLRYLPLGSIANGIYADSTMPAALYRQYLQWQMVTARANARRVRAAVFCARKPLARLQIRFAHWQAKQGNPTAARYHAVQYLAMEPGGISQLAGLRKLGMAYQLDDIAPAMAEDPAFAKTIQTAAHRCNDHTDARELLDDTGPVGKQSNLFKLRLAHFEINVGHSREALTLLSEVFHAWPKDATAASRLTDLFISQERWEEARISFNATPEHYRHFRRRREHMQMIATEKLSVKSENRPFSDTFYGQRDLGGALLPGYFLESEPSVPAPHV